MEVNVFDQLVPVGGTKNLRDIGGIATPEGLVVRRGVLFRSDTLHEAVMEDLARLNLACVIDFRSEAEVERRPDRLDGLNMRWVNLPVDNPRSAGSHFVDQEDLPEFRVEMIQHWLNRDFDAVGRMVDELSIDIAGDRVKRYQSFATDFAHVFAEFFAELVAVEGRPLLYHCEGGTDRTGVATALLLDVLGVDREAVMEDYLATNTVAAKELEELRQLAPPSLWPIIGAQPKQMQAFLDHIDSECGGINNYARSHLNLTDDAVAQLRSTYLVSP
ncbi:MAG: tyrosine-protein phosphatase [bacterium]|nr:tyrosine-protein phosphatase [bacterium]